MEHCAEAVVVFIKNKPHKIKSQTNFFISNQFQGKDKKEWGVNITFRKHILTANRYNSKCFSAGRYAE